MFSWVRARHVQHQSAWLLAHAASVANAFAAVAAVSCHAWWVIPSCHVVQVRQHTEHKRTFMFLEQVILKYNAAATCINIKDIHEVITQLFM